MFLQLLRHSERGLEGAGILMYRLNFFQVPVSFVLVLVRTLVPLSLSESYNFFIHFHLDFRSS